MAEQVQAILDRMVPALRDLMNKGIFSETEIKAIVSRRRSSEYLLRRRNPRNTDFSRYIEAEENLEKLRSLRNKRFMARKAAKEREEGTKEKKKEGAPNASSSSSSMGDASIVQLIHLIFARAKRKWQHDLTWHLQHAEFAKRSCSFKILSKIYAEALQLHPRKASLWIEAASHEFFGYVTSDFNFGMSGGGSIKNARILLQRGLRINPSSKELWIQYFCLEMHYIQKLRGRRKLLQLDQQAVMGDADDHEDEDGGDGESPKGFEAVFEEAKLPRIIYRNAIAAIPDDVQFRVEFVNRCHSFPRSAVLEEEIMDSVKADFGGVEEAWIARASYELESGGFGENDQDIGFLKGVDGKEDDDSDVNVESSGEVSRKRKRVAADPNAWAPAEDKVAELLDEATTSVNTPNMYIKSITFLRHHLLRLSVNDEKSIIQRNEEKMATIGRSITFLLNKAADKQVTSPQLALINADVLVETGRPLQAAQSLQHKIQHDKKCRNSPRCWTRWADISRRMQILPSQTLAADDKTMRPHRSTKILRDALDVIPIHDSGHYAILSRLFLTLIVAASPSTTKMSKQRRLTIEKEIANLFQRLLLLNHQIRTPQTDDYHFDEQLTLPSLTLAYFHHLILSSNVRAAQKVYRQVLFESNYVQRPEKTGEEVDDTVELYESSIAMEVTSLEDDDGHGEKKVAQDALRRLYDGVIGFLEGREDLRLAHVFRRRKMEDIV